MKNWRRALPAILGTFVLMAVACTPPATGGGPGSSNAAPIANIQASATSGNVPLNVAFDGSASIDPDGSIASYSWNFGNATTGSGISSSTTYTAGGTFTAVLTVTDDLGATDTDSITITVAGDGDGDGYFPPADCNDADPTIHPGAADPAGDDIDQNCDGIDGERNDAVFVNSATGGDTSGCGTITEPCASIDQGQNRAVDTGQANVFVAGGTYAKFSVRPGLEVRGGYGQNWQRGVTATSPVTATVNASFDASVGGPVALLADNITAATRVADLRIVGTTAAAGQTSYGVVVRNSTSALVLDSLNVIGGTGGLGGNGAAGAAGWSAAAGNGGTGQNGFEPGGACNTTSAGEPGGGGSGANNGGTGGRGGAVDGSCGWTGLCSNCDARPGNAGVVGAGVGGGTGGVGGNAGTSGVPGVCNIQGNRATDGYGGQPGAAGAAGTGGAGGGAGLTGAPGNLGSHGAAGGGGGGGGGADCGTDDAGAGGGGGGAGGARATSGGGGGLAGAPSIAIRLQVSSPVLTGVQITLGTGGKGGNGGAGAFGQPGGAGGNGGANYERGGAGGRGGDGGTGGASGVGGGGGGGAAVGLSRTSSSSPTGSPSYSGGTGGAGGTGANTGATGTVQNSLVA